MQLTSFVGRERELAGVAGLLRGTRLLTLTGPGGCGKTRLAMAAVRQVADEFEDGARWAWLASVPDPDLLAEAVASATGVRETPGVPPMEAMLEHIGDGEMLLALDNCEHLVEACAGLADTLLRTCPGLRILATSREALDVAGETVWPVPALSLPDPRAAAVPEHLLGYEAVKLFVERARTAVPDFALTGGNAGAVARICVSLDGIPLAIELAAARVRALSAEQIADRLDDSLGLLAGGRRAAPAHHRTLRQTLDWSHDLLPEEEKVLFRRLSVFVGGFALETAEGICAGDGLPERDVLWLLSRLVDKSLVLVTGRGENEARYRLLKMVRQYAAEKLRFSDEEESLGSRHARFYLELAERAEPELTGPEQEAWLDGIDAELGNIRAALAWCSGYGERGAEVGLRLAGALWRFCYLRGHYSEGRGWLESALAADGSEKPSSRAKALTGSGVLALLQCDYGRARERLEEGLALYRELGDEPGVASALQVLGSVARERGLYAEAEAYHEGSLGLWRKLGDESGVARSLNYLGFAAWLQEKHERAAEVCGGTLGAFRRLGDSEGVVWALVSLASASLYAGDASRAGALLEESLNISRRTGYREGIAWSLNQLGLAALRRGEHARAEEMLRESLRTHRDLGDRWRMASVLEGLAQTALARRSVERAAWLIGVAAVLRETISTPIPPCERADHARALSETRAALGEIAFLRNEAQGRAMPLTQAISSALAEVGADPRRPVTAGRAAATSHELSAREIEVLKLVAEGLTDSQVAGRLYLSPRTVGHHLRSIYRKLDVPSRAAAATVALERGLI